MTTRTAVIVVLLLIAGAVAVSIALYPSLPERVPMHWNLHGQVDGWMPKSWGAFLTVGFMALSLLLIVGGQWLSPANFKVEPFRCAFNYLMVIASAMGAYVHGLVLTAALNPDGDYGRWLIAGIFVFFAWIGNFLGKTRRNFWVGIRTPWALADERVWIATHRLGAWIITGAGLAGAVATILGVPPIWCFILLLAALAVPCLYSFWLSRKIENQTAL